MIMTKQLESKGSEKNKDKFYQLEREDGVHQLVKQLFARGVDLATFELALELARLAVQKQYSEQRRDLLCYLSLTDNTTDVEEFICALANQAPHYREDLMTIVEQLREIGRKEGLQEGYQLGRQDGVKEANLRLAKQLLSDGVARENIKRYTSLSDSELDKL